MTTQYTDTQLKQALAKMLPEKIRWNLNFEELTWTNIPNKILHPVLDTELLHLCWMVEKRLNPPQQINYIAALWKLIGVATPDQQDIWWALNHATWQQRTIALAKVLVVEIV